MKKVVFLLFIICSQVFAVNTWTKNRYNWEHVYFDGTVDLIHTTYALFDSSVFKIEKTTLKEWQLKIYDNVGVKMFEVDSSGAGYFAGTFAVAGITTLSNRLNVNVSGAVVGLSVDGNKTTGNLAQFINDNDGAVGDSSVIINKLGNIYLPFRDGRYVGVDGTSCITWTGSGNGFVGPTNIKIIIDANNSGTTDVFSINHNNYILSSATELMRVDELGRLSLGTSANTTARLKIDGQKTTDNLFEAVNDDDGVATGDSSAVIDKLGRVLSQWIVGCAGFADSTSIIAAAVNVPSQITNSANTLMASHRADYVTVAGDTMTVTKTGWYNIRYDWSFSGNNTDLYHLSVRINNVEVANILHCLRGITTTKPGVVSAGGDIYLTVGDDISFWIENTANNNDPTFYEGNVNVYYTGE